MTLPEAYLSRMCQTMGFPDFRTVRPQCALADLLRFLAPPPHPKIPCLYCNRLPRSKVHGNVIITDELFTREKFEQD